MMNNPEKFLTNLKEYKAVIDDGRVPPQNVERARKIKEIALPGKPIHCHGLPKHGLKVAAFEPKPHGNLKQNCLAGTRAANDRLAQVKELVSTLQDIPFSMLSCILGMSGLVPRSTHPQRHVLRRTPEGMKLHRERMTKRINPLQKEA
eukprot:4885942-Amphidinium_carterae.2